MAGRQTKLTPQLQTQLTNVIGAGNYFRTACQYAGISETTFFEWLQRGEGTHPTRKRTKPLAEFAEAIRKAEAQAEVARVARIAKAGQEGVWQADAWYLERRYPDRWGRRVQDLRVTETDTPFNPESMTDEQLLRIAAGEDPAKALASGRQGEGVN